MLTLTKSHIESYHRNGFLLLASYFSDYELALMWEGIELLQRGPSPRQILETDGAIRSFLGPHQVSARFSRLARLEKIVLPAFQLLGHRDVYLHQTKVNHKRALSGERCDWHQDFSDWHQLDGFPSSGSITAGIFLDDVDTISGPLILIPGSHHLGMAELPVHEAHRESSPSESSFASALTFRLDAKTLDWMLEGRQPFQATGRAGFIVFFNDLVFHGSNTNMGPRDRTSIYLSYNAISNRARPVPNPRPEFVASRDFTPVTDLIATLE